MRLLVQPCDDYDDGDDNEGFSVFPSNGAPVE
jgi:hypothetical protein